MSLFASVFKIRFKTGVQYRIPALAGMCTQFFFGFVFIMIYRAFYKNVAPGTDTGITLERLVTYIWLTQAFLYMIVIWIHDRETMDMIRTGGVAYELARPVDLYVLWFAKMVGQRISGVVLRFLPILAVAFFLPEGYRLMPPESVTAFLLFFISLVMGLVIVTSFLLLVYMSGFYTINITGFLNIAMMFSDACTGQFLPIVLMPADVQRVLYKLPFAYISDFAFRLYTGSIPAGEALGGLATQLAWAVALPAAGYFVLRRAVKRTVIQGG